MVHLNPTRRTNLEKVNSLIHQLDYKNADLQIWIDLKPNFSAVVLPERGLHLGI